MFPGLKDSAYSLVIAFDVCDVHLDRNRAVGSAQVLLTPPLFP